MELIGDPYEGLVYAIGHTLRNVLTGDIKGALDNKDRMGKVYFAMLDAAAMFFLFKLIVAILKG